MSRDLKMPIMIDVEASGFGAGSYPIEIGFVDEQRKPHCFLIEPMRQWRHWDPSAEEKHGISRRTLEDYGRPADEVAWLLNGLLKDKAVFSDAWSFDISWLGKLFDAVGQPQLFHVHSLLELLTECQVEHWSRIRSQVIEELALGRHRASSDAMILQETWLRSRCAGDPAF